VRDSRNKRSGGGGVSWFTTQAIHFALAARHTERLHERSELQSKLNMSTHRVEMARMLWCSRKARDKRDELSVDRYVGDLSQVPRLYRLLLTRYDSQEIHLSNH
jgi:hypothetical protein